MIGDIVGSYQIQRVLGEGGMGIVYVAEHPLLRKKAVVKFLHAELSANAEMVERFFNEALAATRIRHSGIVDIFDFGRHANGAAFILMEHLEGESLGARLQRGALDPAMAIIIGRQIASALGAAHAQGIVHRDLKPDNVYLVTDREAPGGVRIKVLDFGIAKLASQAAGAVKTRTNAMMGTPHYMAPEQCKSAAHVDERADIYALGCILFEMVTGVIPFKAESLAQLIGAHMFEPPPRPRMLQPSISPDLEATILSALAKDPAHRPQTMEALSTQLATCSERGSVLPPPDSLSPSSVAPATASPRTTLAVSSGQIMSPPQSTRGRWMAVAIAILVVAASVAVLLSRDERSPTVASTPNDAAIRADGRESSTAAASPDAPMPTDTDAPPVPANVTLRILSKPSGASVIRELDAVEVGTTPFVFTRPASVGTTTFIVRLAKHHDERVVLSVDHDNEESVVFRPIGRAPKKVPPTPSSSSAPGADGMLVPK